MGDDSIDELIDQHGEETVRKAFWLQEKIYEEGIEPVHFSEKSENAMRQVAKINLRNQIDSHTQKDF